MIFTFSIKGLFGVPAKIKMPREIVNDELTEKLFHIVRSVSQDLAGFLTDNYN